MRLVLLATAAALTLTACRQPAVPEQVPPGPELATRADSIAYRIVEASGGLTAWDALPGLEFSFGFSADGAQRHVAHHIWDRRNNRYRVEWAASDRPDDRYVALFSDWPEAGEVFLNGAPVDSIGDGPALAAAQRRTINDTYWLLAPLKVFDPGVHRTAEPDSADATHEVIRLSFEDVGITPGDRYWLFSERETGRLARWTFALQGGSPPRSFNWTDYHTLEGPGGPVMLSARKEPLGTGNVVLTDGLSVPDLSDTLFEDPNPRWRP